jgi:hypothetical protein
LNDFSCVGHNKSFALTATVTDDAFSIAMASTMTVKITSLGSQSEGHSEPHPTPATEALDAEVVTTPPPMDFAAVTKILAPITESLNESAEEAMYPSPPINTPIVGSPTPSMKYRFPIRGRGLSAVGDRLAKLKIDNRKSHRHHHQRETDVTSSCRSMEPSVAEDGDECDEASISDVLSDSCRDKECPGHASMSMSPSLFSPPDMGLVPIALGSPTLNPRIAEFLSFTSNDLPDHAPAPATGTTLAEHASSTSTTALDANSMRSHVSLMSEGVTEKSNWAEDLEDNLEHMCLRLEQLAKDEHNANPSYSTEDYYVARLHRLLGDSSRNIPVKVAKSPKP